VCKKLLKNSQPFAKNCQKTAGGIFFTHTVEVWKRPTRNVAFSQMALGPLVLNATFAQSGATAGGGGGYKSVRFKNRLE